MTVHEAVIAKIQNLPEPLVVEVGNFVDFLLVRSSDIRWQLWTQFSESLELSESDMSDYLSNLESYEDKLAAGEIKW